MEMTYEWKNMTPSLMATIAKGGYYCEIDGDEKVVRVKEIVEIETLKW